MRNESSIFVNENPDLLYMELSLVFEKRTNSGVKTAVYNLIENLYPETYTELDDKDKEDQLPLKDVKEKFGSGDNCGESESGDDEAGSGNP